MAADLFDRFSAQPHTSQTTYDAGFAARPRFVRLRDALLHAAKFLGRSRWNEPPIFFFDPKRHAELEAARPVAPEHFAKLTALIESEMPLLFATVGVRRVARAVDGLATAAKTLAEHCPAARELADLLAVPDDEVFLVLNPAARTGVRIHLRGAADVWQLRRLVAEPTPGLPSLKGRGELSSTSPLEGEGKNVPQLFTPAALQPDGTLPAGFTACKHWLWPTQPLAAVPRINGERVVLVGPAVVQAANAEPRFPTLAAEREVIQTLNAFQTAEMLSRLCGQLVPVQTPAEATPVARAA